MLILPRRKVYYFTASTSPFFACYHTCHITLLPLLTHLPHHHISYINTPNATLPHHHTPFMNMPNTTLPHHHTPFNTPNALPHHHTPFINTPNTTLPHLPTQFINTVILTLPHHTSSLPRHSHPSDQSVTQSPSTFTCYIGPTRYAPRTQRKR